jgi:hypothetical protein
MWPAAAVRNARTVIAQVNPNMPRTLGRWGRCTCSRFAALVQVNDALARGGLCGLHK